MGRWRGKKAAAILACATLVHVAAVPPARAEDRPAPALRAALALSAGGDDATAAARFEAIARRWPLVGDHAERLAAESWLAAGEAVPALEAAQRIVGNHPQTPLGTDAARLEAEAHVAKGELPAALDAYQRAHRSAETTEVRRALRAAWAQTAEAAGQLETARDHWLVIWRQVPGTPEDDLAREALARLEGNGLPAPHAADWGNRAESQFDANDAAGSIDAFDRALAGEIPERTRKHLSRKRAFALFRAREYRKAYDAFGALDGSEAGLYRARSLARAGDLDAAIEAFEEIGRSRSSQAFRARYLVATLLDDDPETLPRAVAHYAAVATGSGQGRERRAAAWRLAWIQRTTGELEKAAGSFDALAAKRDPIGALQPRYWAARCREDLAPNAAPARAEFAELARSYPLTYYGWRSAARAGEGADLTAAPVSPALGQQRLGGAPVERVEILTEAGLLKEAGDEVVRLEARARTLADRLLVADLALAAERPDRARTLAAQGREELLARGVAPDRKALWAHAWPRPWQPQVAASAADAGVEPALVWAVMREESGFRSAVVSPAGAHGLLQLMTETATRLEGELGSPGPLPRALHEPAVNIRFGTHLLGKLAAEFPGRRSAAIGAYNAGSGPVSRWLGERGELPDDAWVESIPYDETRAYVRRVLRSYHAYRTIY